ncbi:glutaminase domain-containing protein [Rhodanobacter aciditrophus]|uniref:glutaminase family protein n=1 Tax=Rhodanobacter aciditrophus TaxID=1623218 RepID=UPI003CF1F8E4
MPPVDASADVDPVRRNVLRLSGIAGLAFAGSALLPAEAKAAMGATSAAPVAGEDDMAAQLAVATPIRPPAVPLAVRQPYLSTWLPATLLPGNSPQFWQGSTTGMVGLARIDGEAWLFMGDGKILLAVPDGNHGKQATVEDFPRAMRQTALRITATRSCFTLQGGGVELAVEFLSPVEPGDSRRQSMPMSYVRVSARSMDGTPHTVQVYMEITGDWASGDDAQEVVVAHDDASTARTWTLALAKPQPLAEQHEFAAWGHVLWSTPARDGASMQAGDRLKLRTRFAGHGALDGSNTAARSTIKSLPALALAVDLGSCGALAKDADFVVGQVREQCINYLGRPLRALWTKHFADWKAMLDFFHGDAAAARQRADALDARVSRDARAVGGERYEGLCVLALRQAYGGTELVQGPDGSPWAFLKEISSDGNVSTVDVLYPASPVWMYLDPDYLRMLLLPLLDYAGQGGWPKPYTEHDLGSAYPLATGHNDGREEDMPVEESGDMLIMIAAWLQRAPRAEARAFAARHYPLLEKWAQYLERSLPDPGFQNQTDDFAGSIAHSVNLALKGIVALAAMGQVAGLAGRDDDAAHYRDRARKDIAYWAARARDPQAPHLDLTYHDAGGEGTWGTLYNGFADTLLGTGLIPAEIRAMQAAWYRQHCNAFGLPLQVPHSYAKSDWALFTAAWLADEPVARELIDRVYAYADGTPDRVPFCDLYSTVTGRCVAFQARPVQGGIFAPLAVRSVREPVS